jgi:polysaccharide export outer membrane protein
LNKESGKLFWQVAKAFFPTGLVGSQQVSGQDLDFVDFFGNPPFRKRAGFSRVALLLFLLPFAQVGTSRAQVDPGVDPSSQTSPDQQPSRLPATSNPYGSTQGPTSGASQQDIDISSPDWQNRTQNGANNRPQTGTSSDLQSRAEDRLAQRYTAPQPPTEFQRIVAETAGRILPIFGADLFNTPPSTFAPVDNIPVTPDYVIGPGDEIRLQVWGQVNQHGSFIVDRTGSISLPEVGTIHVAGVRFSQLSDFLKSNISRVYRNFDLNVNLGQLRSIQVFVVGRARKPGSYTIGSLSSLLNALFASGGPLPQGSVRDIQVKRDGQTVTHFDLYDLLLHGDKTKDIRLISGDVIFIPDVGPQVAVTGSVNSPAIYELRGETSFTQIVAMAGGLTNGAAGSAVRVERIDRHSQRSMIDVDLASTTSVPVQDGDIVSVISILQHFQNAVTLRGNVANPGRYVWHEGMRISDLVPNRDALVTRNYYQRLNQLGQTPPAFPRLIEDNNTIGTAGAPYNSQAQSGSFSPRSVDELGNSQSSAPYPSSTQNNLTGLGAGYGSEGSLRIQSESAAQGNVPRQTTGTNAGGGSVGEALAMSNGTFQSKNDVVLAAPDIDWQYAVVERQNATDLKTNLLPFNLSKAVLDKEPSQDLQLLAGDVVTIFSKADIRVPSEQQTKIVHLEGEFVGAGIYSVEPGETLHHLLARAGGLTPEADLFASEFTRESVRRVQKQRLLEFADQLESQISANASATAATATSALASNAAQQSAESGRALVSRLRQAEPSGRIVLNLKPDSAGIVALPDLALQDGDRFIVPRVPATVAVEGQVYNANAFLYQRGKRVKDYLRLAGGPDRIGDRKREFILRADGSVVSHQEESLGHRALFTGQDFEDVVLFPGDTIIVPPQISKTAVLRNLSDFGTILTGFGIAAAAIQVLK